MALLSATIIVETGRAPVGDFSKFPFWRTELTAEVNVTFSETIVNYLLFLVIRY